MNRKPVNFPYLLPMRSVIFLLIFLNGSDSWYYWKRRDPVPVMVGHALIDLMTVSWVLATSMIPGFYETMCGL